jgi:hypothetical protein
MIGIKDSIRGTNMKVYHKEYRSLSSWELMQQDISEDGIEMGYIIIPIETYHNKKLVVHNGEIMLAHVNRHGNEVGYIPVNTEICKYNSIHFNRGLTISSPYIKGGDVTLIGNTVFMGEYELDSSGYGTRDVTIQVYLNSEKLTFSTIEKDWIGFTPEQLAARDLRIKSNETAKEKITDVIAKIKANPKMGLNARLLGRMKRMGDARLYAAEIAVKIAWSHFYGVLYRDLESISPRNLLPIAK